MHAPDACISSQMGETPQVWLAHQYTNQELIRNLTASSSFSWLAFTLSGGPQLISTSNYCETKS